MRIVFAMLMLLTSVVAFGAHGDVDDDSPVYEPYYSHNLSMTWLRSGVASEQAETTAPAWGPSDVLMDGHDTIIGVSLSTGVGEYCYQADWTNAPINFAGDIDISMAGALITIGGDAWEATVPADLSGPPTIVDDRRYIDGAPITWDECPAEHAAQAFNLETTDFVMAVSQGTYAMPSYPWYSAEENMGALVGQAIRGTTLASGTRVFAPVWGQGSEDTTTSLFLNDFWQYKATQAVETLGCGPACFHSPAQAVFILDESSSGACRVDIIRDSRHQFSNGSTGDSYVFGRSGPIVPQTTGFDALLFKNHCNMGGPAPCTASSVGATSWTHEWMFWNEQQGAQDPLGGSFFDVSALYYKINAGCVSDYGAQTEYAMSAMGY